MNENGDKNEKARKRNHWRNNGFEEGYMNAKMRKLEEQILLVKANIALNQLSGDNSNDSKDLFRGVSIHVNGYTNPSADDLKKLILMHGGDYDHYYSTSKTTHIIATNLAFCKIRKLKNEKVVKPEWIVDSIRERRLLPYINYALYTPNQKIINFSNQAVASPLTPIKVNENESNNQLTPTKKHTHTKSPVAAQSLSNQPVIEASTSKCNLNFETKNVSSNQSKTLTATDPNFVQEYFKRSRLHHISTSSNDLKNYVEHLIDTHNGNFSGLETLCKVDNHETQYSRVIMIVDMDCFFVSVALRKRPHLKDKPVAVTHSRTGRGPQRGLPENDAEIKVYQKYYQYYLGQPENKSTASLENSDFGELDGIDEVCVNDDVDNNETRSVQKTFDASGSCAEIASCNYVARQLGVKNGMYVGTAVKMCPNLVTLPYEFEEYSKVSKILYDTISTYTLKIEAVSCDECFVDITDILNNYDIHPLDLASKIRREIFLKTGGCNCSVGIASNVLLAKLALKSAKPNGQHFLPNDKPIVNSYISNIKVGDLPGIGYSTSNRLKEVFGVFTCGDLQNVSLSNLQKEFGEKNGKNLYEHCRGIDRSVLKIYQTQNRKSISAIVNYGIRFTETSQVNRFLMDLAKEVANRMDAISAKGKLIGLRVLTRSKDAPVQTLKFLGCGMCDSTCKSTTLRIATNNPNVIGNEVITLMKSIKHNVVDLRGIGIQIGKLEFPQSSSNSANHLQTMSANKNLLHYFGNNTNVPKETNEDVEVLMDTSPTSSVAKNDEISREAKKNLTKSCTSEAQLKNSFAGLPDSFSMIDKETLDSLPEYIRREILSNYNIPVKNSENKKRNGKVSQKKGKDKKASKTKPKSSVEVQEGPLDRIFKDIISGKKQINILDVNLSQVAHICGKTDVDSMLSLIREWIITEEHILDDDYAYITNFLMKLVEDRNYTLLTTVMQTFYETVSERNSNDWKALFNNILKSIIAEISDCDRKNVAVSEMVPFVIN